MRAVNLLPQDEQPRSFAAYRGVAFGAGGGVAFVSVALVALTISAGGAIQQQNAERDSLNAELAALPPAPVDQQDSSANATLAFEKSQRITALSSALSTRVAWDRVLSQISQVLPEDVWLTSLTSQSAPAPDASSPTGAVGPAGASVTLIGSTYSQRGVARLLARLGVLPALSDVQLLSSSSQEMEPKDIVQFTIQATIKTPGASQ
jgi:Tfp pilus assembly protein PilN